ncbi:GL17263 [Drosophila persimilis]|uniref:GL17263 n=1 Tax=Drosophila persimilis TaxID=7234 RepID=B4GIT1_DROPE|nr:GL17263 [Drosophila persimilis]
MLLRHSLALAMFRLALIFGLYLPLYSPISGSSICGRNEVQVACGNPCPKSCYPQRCVDVLCYGRCNCIGGYRRVNKYQGPCVLPSECGRYPMWEIHKQTTNKGRSKRIQFQHQPINTQRQQRHLKDRRNKTTKINPRSVKEPGNYADLWTTPRDTMAYDYFDLKHKFVFEEMTTRKRSKPSTTSKPATTESPFMDLWATPRDAEAYHLFDHKPPWDFGDMTTKRHAKPLTTPKPATTESPFIQEHIQR